MGQKVNPVGLRLGIVKTWESRWYADKNYSDYILEDYKIRRFIKVKLYHAGVSRIEIERSSKLIRLRIYTARPGIVIGKKGAEISQLKKEIEKLVSHEVLIDIQEVRKPEIYAQLVAENVALQIERRVAFRRAMKRGVTSAMRFGAMGVKIICSGRLGGAAAYWKMHAWLLENQESYSDQTLRVAAETLGIDPAALLLEMEKPATGEAVQGDTRIGGRLAADKVPSLFINGRRVPRWKQEEESILPEIIAEAAKE